MLNLKKKILIIKFSLIDIIYYNIYTLLANINSVRTIIEPLKTGIIVMTRISNTVLMIMKSL
jgi:hypothetical protein